MSSEDFQLSCDDTQRRLRLQKVTTLNGIDYLEVVPPEVKGDVPLLVVFLYEGLTSATSLGPRNIQISGGTRITPIYIEWAYRFADLPLALGVSAGAKVQAIITANVTIPDPSATNVLVIRPTSDGDFSTYTLRLVDVSNTSQPPAGFDVLLSECAFGFKVECPQNFDCRPDIVCPPAPLEEPVIDYLTKDFNSFNTLMLNRLSLINPAWQERHAADMGVALVELLAYVGDQLSYYQDAFATEAYLETARRRVSIRRHARLLDYFMHEGCNARAWVTMEIDPSADGLLVPARTGLLTGGDGDSTVVTGGLDKALAGATVFETMTDVTLYSAQNLIQFYTWQEEDCCLPLGGTTVTLRNDHNALDLPVFTLTGVSSLGTGTGQSALISALAGASTTTLGTNNAGQDVLSVASTAGFGAGEVIMINPGDNQESAIVAYVQVGSVVLDSNLAKAHAPGEVVSVVPLATYLLNRYNSRWVVRAHYTIDSGPTGTTIAGTTPSVLQDATAAWSAGEWVGDNLEYTSGPATGEYQPIASNTPTAITTAVPFSPAPTPTGGDSFSIVTKKATITLSDGVHSASVAFGAGIGSATVTVDGTQVDELVVTSAVGDLKFSAHTLRIGDVLIFEEIRSPTTGRRPDADPSHRCAVRLTRVSATLDPLDALSTPLLDVSWDTADAPSFLVCLEMVRDPDFGDLLEPVSVAHGNVVLADNGQTRSLGTLTLQPVTSGTTSGNVANVMQDTGASWIVNQWVDYYLEYTSGPAEGQSMLITANTANTITTAVPFSPAPTPAGGDSFNIASSGYADAKGNFYIGYTEFLGDTPKQDADEDGGGRFRPGLSYQPLTFAAPFFPSEPASSAFGYDVTTALPSITVLGEKKSWLPQRDLLSSDEFQNQFVAEVDNDGTAYLRFGDGVLGSAPTPSTKLVPNPYYAIYRTGNGRSGNVGREAISRIVNASVYGSLILTKTPFDGTGILTVRNPMEAQGGTDPEDVEDVRQFAPYAFDSQQRAVTPQDYQTLLSRYSGVEQSYAQLRWTGSWWTYYVSVDRTGGIAVDSPFKQGVETYLNFYRMEGYDLEVTDPVLVPLQIELHACAAPGFNPDDVRKELYDAFSSKILPDGAKGFFYPDNFTFGQTVFLSTIYETATSLPGVSSVVVKVFQRYGRISAHELENGEITMAASEVARLDNDPNFPENGILTIKVDGGEAAKGVGALP